ncbi:hypothetical protein ACSCB1_35260 [Streptomyces europaeiscabiei]|uniref:hypothetical protein n=1 Tax=Streptomyces europaeiscabiei TaxID=146819 RepID=UPI000AD069A3|nr:hypothetical protein [Streptomyces europaeiscabiei]
MSNWIFVDCEARGASPANGTMTEFGAVHEATRQTFHGVLYEGIPDPENPAIPIVGRRLNSDWTVAMELTTWLADISKGERPVFVSDNPAFDWQWIAAMFDTAGIPNPFGHSARRISDFYAGLMGNWGDTQGWKQFRETPHDHNPVNDAMGNVEAFQELKRMAKARRMTIEPVNLTPRANKLHVGGAELIHGQWVMPRVVKPSPEGRPKPAPIRGGEVRPTPTARVIAPFSSARHVSYPNTKPASGAPFAEPSPRNKAAPRVDRAHIPRREDVELPPPASGMKIDQACFLELYHILIGAQIISEADALTRYRYLAEQMGWK